MGMLLAVTAELPGSLQKCIFDEVQSQVMVVTTTPTHQDRPPSETFSGAHARQEHALSSGMGESKHTPLGQNASPQQIPSLRQTRTLREIAPPIRDPPQPIRIRTWVPRESSLVLSQAERDRLEPSVEEAVGVVSSLLSGAVN